MLSSVHENCDGELSAIPQPRYLCLFGSVFLVTCTAPNKQLTTVNSAFKSFDYVNTFL